MEREVEREVKRWRKVKRGGERWREVEREVERACVFVCLCVRDQGANKAAQNFTTGILV